MAPGRIENCRGVHGLAVASASDAKPTAGVRAAQTHPKPAEQNRAAVLRPELRRHK